ncbi:MAG: M28 family peptidase [Gammaproteobacteria bacterium]|nr:M28 family peptidase [Gammaproteobacteria bacterium]
MFRAISLVSALTLGAAADPSLPGFTDTGAEAQRDLEAEFDRHLDPSDLRAWMHELAGEPHHVGSAHGQRNVETLKRLFTEWGYDTEIASYDVLFPTPRTRRLEMIEPHAFTASLVERSVAGDESSASPDVLPPYNVFSPDGDVTGQLVYVNYGLLEDYEQLERYGVDVAGKIVIARYGYAFRAIKPKLAAERGAIGCLIYSDPSDDGYVLGKAYPEGPYKNDSAVQRGSIKYTPLYAGDPLTPGWAATANAKRLDIQESKSLATIPTLPISYGDALPLLDAMEGPVAPPEWRGGLPITYRIGPGPATVRLQLAFDWNTVTAQNVIATRQGAVWPDQWVIRGNHHDAWSHGARDPVSGLISMLAEAKAISMLKRAPARTIVFAAWDAEEQGLMGSAEWAEEHREELRDKAVLYANTDGITRGFVRVGGSHALEKFFNAVQRDVIDPQTGLSVAARNRARIRVSGDEAANAALDESGLLRLSALGSGSDYTTFLHHVGIATANLAIGGEGGGGSYHTLYDTVEHYERFGDPGYVYGVVLAQVSGRATLRLANARLLPFDFTDLVDTVRRYVKELEALADAERNDVARLNRLIDSGEFAAALDPTKALRPPARRQSVPHFNFAPIHNALARAEEALDGYAVTPDADDSVLGEINRLLFTGEQLLTREEGLPGRPWYRHQIYAPGYYTGYGAKTLPWIREALEHRQYDQVAAGVDAVAATMQALAARIEDINTLAHQ